MIETNKALTEANEDFKKKLKEMKKEIMEMKSSSSSAPPHSSSSSVDSDALIEVDVQKKFPVLKRHDRVDARDAARALVKHFKTVSCLNDFFADSQMNADAKLRLLGSLHLPLEVGETLLDTELNDMQRIVDAEQRRTSRIIRPILPMLADGDSNTKWKLLEDTDKVYGTIVALWNAKPLDEDDIFLGPKAMPVSEWTQLEKPNNVVVELPENVVMVPTPSSTAGFSNEKARLFIRPNTMDVMKDVFGDMDGEDSTTRFMRILGTPGVGKSRSIDYALWLGIHQRRIVFVCNVNRGRVYAVVPSADESDPPIVLQIDMMHWNARVVPALLGAASLEYLPKHRPLYLFDPNKEDVVSVLVMYANMIVFVSPNDSNVPGARGEQSDHVYMDPWSVEQLVAVREYIGGGANLTDEQVRNRYAKCGGAPRYIFMNDGKYDHHLKELLTKIKRLTHMTVRDLYNDIPDFDISEAIPKATDNISYMLLKVIGKRGNRKEADVLFLSTWV